MELSRCRGFVLGMAAGDKVRCPFRMALCTLAAIADNDGRYDHKRTLCGCLRWFSGRDIGWDETGPVTRKVFQRMLKDIGSATDINANCIDGLGDIFKYSESVNDEYKGFTTDIDPIYRTIPLALLSDTMSEEQLINCIRKECQITHRSEIAQFTCVSVVLLTSLMIKGETFENSANEIAKKMSFCFPVQNAIIEGLEERNPGNLSRGSYCVDVLKLTTYCLKNFSGFSSTLDASLSLAGSSNFCPVLVGALAGAREGCRNQSSFKSYVKQWEPRDLCNAEDYVTKLYNLAV